MKWARLLALALVPALSNVAVAASPSFVWETAFSTRTSPKAIHFRASYADGAGKAHALEVWREGDERLRRDTDGKMSLYVKKRAGGEYEYEVIDRENKTRVEVSRTNLYRIGVFSDWPSLATNLTKPPGAVTLTVGKRGTLRTKIGDCRWIRVEAPPAPAREICWSSALALPLAIERDLGEARFARELTVDEVSTRIPDGSVFQAPRDGFFEVDANRDIRGDD